MTGMQSENSTSISLSEYQNTRKSRADNTQIVRSDLIQDWLKQYLVWALIFIFALVLALLILHRPEAERNANPPAPRLAVKVKQLQQQNYNIEIASYGVVRPRVQSILVAQVAGQINFVNPSFRDGGFFEAGEVLIALDDRDQQADLKLARANLLEAKQILAEEQARGLQAKEDWRRLGNNSEAPDLVLRRPQLAAAEARLTSAEAAYNKQQLNLERTKIVAPYAGRVLSKNVDLGQVVANNGRLATIYSVDFVEVRLPIKNKELALIDLPERYRYSEQTTTEAPDVTISSDLGGSQYQWQGKLIRTEGAVDDTSRQLHVIAQIEDPYGIKAEGKPALKIGQYVTARIKGKNLPDALVIPNRSIYQGSYVYIVEDEVLLRREVEILWQNDKQAVIAAGLKAGDALVLTPLGQVMSGTRATIKNGADGNKGPKSQQRKAAKGKQGTKQS